MKHWQLPGLLAAGALLLSACGTTPDSMDAERDRGPDTPPDLSHLEEPEPRDEPRSRYGNPASYEVFGQTYFVMADMPDEHVEEGMASWYGEKFHGRRTSSGEPYDMYALTAAHKELPIPAYVRVTRLDNDRSVIVRVNDRGPFAPDRIIDLSYAAAQRLDMVDTGTAPVRIEVLRGDTATAEASDPSEPATNRQSATPVASTRAAAAEPQPASRLPGQVTEADNAGRYFVQVGAFARRENADRLGRDLREAGLGPVRIQSGDDPDRQLYRVRLGPLDSEEEMDRLKERLRQRGLEGNPVVLNQ